MLPSVVLGKRDREENTTNLETTNEPSVSKRKKVHSYGQFSKEQKEKKDVDEMLAKFLVTPKVTFAEMGGLGDVIQ